MNHTSPSCLPVRRNLLVELFIALGVGIGILGLLARISALRNLGVLLEVALLFLVTGGSWLLVDVVFRRVEKAKLANERIRNSTAVDAARKELRLRNGGSLPPSAAQSHPNVLAVLGTNENDRLERRKAATNGTKPNKADMTAAECDSMRQYTEERQ